MDERTLGEVNARIARGGFTHLDGTPARLRLACALASSDGRFIYPVVDGIFVLVPSLAITQTGHTHATFSERTAPETESVMRFYDEIGWQSGEHDRFRDADRFEDLRPVSRDYIHRCHMRVNRYIPRRGTYLLDVASGPLQYSEYLTYSEGYDYRLCGDISLTALRAARERLGGRGTYIQCDITQLPLKDACVDAFVSLHTIYHVPEGRQVAAFRELERVLMDGRSGVVVYTWGPHSLAMKLLTGTTCVTSDARRLLKRILPERVGTRLREANGARSLADSCGVPPVDRPEEEGPTLYFHPHDYAWFRRNVASGGRWHIAVWRSVSVPVLVRYVHEDRLGRPMLSVLFRLESMFPRFFGRFGHYPLMVYRSPSAKL